MNPHQQFMDEPRGVLTRAFLGLPAPDVAKRKLRELANGNGVRLPASGIAGWGDAGYIREDFQDEIKEALDRLTEKRP